MDRQGAFSLRPGQATTWREVLARSCSNREVEGSEDDEAAREGGLFCVCRACLSAGRCKSSSQRDGREVIAKRKGVRREVKSERSVEQRHEPMYKNRI